MITAILAAFGVAGVVGVYLYMERLRAEARRVKAEEALAKALQSVHKAREAFKKASNSYEEVRNNDSRDPSDGPNNPR